ncbi:unnamed protein product, partial [Didymodactylos carnosus]
STNAAHIHRDGAAKKRSLFSNDNFLSYVNKNEQQQQQQQYLANNHQLKNDHSRREILPSEHDDIYKRLASPRLGKRASDSSEYFSWANKNDRPLEYLRANADWYPLRTSADIFLPKEYRTGNLFNKFNYIMVVYAEF